MNFNSDYVYLFNNNPKSYSSTSNKKYVTPENTLKIKTEIETKKIGSNNSANSANSTNKSNKVNIPVLSNEIYNRMFLNNNFKNMNDGIKRFLTDFEDSKFNKFQKIKLVNLKEYTEFLKFQFQAAINMKKEAEKSMYSINKYLDFVILSNDDISSSYLGGFENKYKINEVTIPDLTGFTSKERTISQMNISIIFLLINNFLELNDIKLNKCIEYLLGFISSELNKQDTIFIELKNYNQDNIPIIKNISNFYFLLNSLLDNGKFNLNKFLSLTKPKITNRSGGADSINYKKAVELLKKRINSGKDKNKKKTSSNKKEDDIDKKIKYILNYEAILEPSINIKNYEDLKEKLRKTWWKEKFDNILYKDLEKLNKDDTYKIPKLLESNGVTAVDLKILSPELLKGDINIIIKKIKTKNSSISKNDKNYLNEIFKNIFSNEESSIVKIFNSESENKFLSLKDFYTNEKIDTSNIISKGDDYFYYNIIQKIYSEYDKYYQNYNIQNLIPKKSNLEEQKQQQKISINVLKGIGNYCNIVRKILDNTIKRIYSNDVMVRERNIINKMKREEAQQQLLKQQQLLQQEKLLQQQQLLQKEKLLQQQQLLQQEKLSNQSIQKPPEEKIEQSNKKKLKKKKNKDKDKDKDKNSKKNKKDKKN
jgi:hypothetical protein